LKKISEKHQSIWRLFRRRRHVPQQPKVFCFFFSKQKFLLPRRRFLAGISLAALPALARAQSAPYPGDIVAPGLTRAILTSWGDPVLAEAPPFDPANLTEQAAATQFPYDAILAGIIAPPQAQDGIPRLVAVFANPTAPAAMLFPAGQDQPAIAGKLQGATILNLQYQSGTWLQVAGGYQSRRLTDGTLCQLSGPAAAAIGATVQGLLAPQAACITPWSTALFAEGDPTPWLARLAGTGLGFADPANAPKFGWIAELNPLDPFAFPIKRTALGRFPRAGLAATQTSDGRPVLFMSQNGPAGMLFRFIAAGNATDGTALDSGTLSVAQIQDDQITWIDLPAGNATLVGTIGAALTAGGSPFDSPAGLAIAPGNTLYLACRGNPARDPLATNTLNPRAGDDNGHILALTPNNGDLTAKTFTGIVAIAAGNPATAQFTQYAPGSTTWFRKPTTLNLDSHSRLWIGTDQNGAVTDTADGLFTMQTTSPYPATQAYLAPIGAAIGAAAFTPTATLAVIRHPGATPAATQANPATRWPSLQPAMPPQTSVIELTS
jgi:secreted PhoX family phosphatase